MLKPKILGHRMISHEPYTYFKNNSRTWRLVAIKLMHEVDEPSKPKELNPTQSSIKWINPQSHRV